MNDNQIDQFFFKLNYQSRFTLASSHQKQTTSPLLSSTQISSIKNSRYLQTSRQNRKNLQQFSADIKQRNIISTQENDCILIEEHEDFQEYLSQDQYLQNSQEQIKSFQLVDSIQKNWIKIQQEKQQEVDSFFIQKIVYQELDYQKSQQKQSINEDPDFCTSIKIKKQKDQFADTLLRDSENCPKMTRNYTFGNNLNQNAFLYQVNKSKEKNQQRDVKNQSFNGIQTLKNKIKTRQRTSKKEQKYTSPKSPSNKALSQSRKQQWKSFQICINESAQLHKDSIFREQSQQQLNQQNQEKGRNTHPLTKSRLYLQSIQRINSIISLLPSKLRNTYCKIKQQLLEKQKDVKQILQAQIKKIKVLQTLIQFEELGKNLQAFILQQSNSLQQRILINQIILRLTIKQLVKKNKISMLKDNYDIYK